MHPHIFQDMHRGRIHAFNLFLVHRFDQRQIAFQCGQHFNIALLAGGGACTSAASGRSCCFNHDIPHVVKLCDVVGVIWIA